MSKNIIFYFSGTGNSLAIAQMLQKQLEDATIMPMLFYDPSIPLSEEAETIGLIYPIHMNAIPREVKGFIDKLKVGKNCYLYAVSTHGGIPGKAGWHLLKVLKDHYIELNSYFEIEMINNTPKGVAPRILMRLDWEEHIGEKAIKDMMERVEYIMPFIVSSIQSHDSKTIHELHKKARGLVHILLGFFWKLNEASKPQLQFVLDKSCTGCGICEKVCTTGRIRMVENEPRWEGDHCNYCYACFNFCPEQAIGVNYYVKKLGRYHYPNVNWNDIAAQKDLSHMSNPVDY